MWRSTCILTWSRGEVQEWLKAKGWLEFFNFVPDGETLAIRTLERLKRCTKDDDVAEDIFSAVTVNLKVHRTVYDITAVTEERCESPPSVPCR